ncbi:MAG: ATP-binding protein [Acidobacteria bacterium]|nr:ATP-binding protein [Acidobacteriota bacterium]
MRITLGDIPDSPPAFGKALRLSFYTQQFPIKWGDCTEIADVISQYFASCFVAENPGAHVLEFTHGVSYMANELIENVVKFRTVGDVGIQAGLDGGTFLLQITNWVTEETSAIFQKLLEELTVCDPRELLVQRIEANALEGKSGSGLGLLTLMSDYGVKLSWSFRPENDGRVFLETLARLPLSLPTSQPIKICEHGN